ncbi:MAG: vitamin B12-dependent ribonucleotide reductase, partial [Verrucomicrobiales bacterium]|nr:vitamin B12-dependent ribonucleotide reductase [Verrucomicrobiales bacterium]
WKMGLKCVAIYRDGSKRSQPLNTKKTTEGGDAKTDPQTQETRINELVKFAAELQIDLEKLRRQPIQPLRRRLPETRSAVTHKFEIAGHEGYLTVGLFEDGRPGELFVTMAKEGSTIGGLMDTIGALTSMALQYGVPLEGLVKKFAHQRFEPSGFTKNPDIRQASSIIDYVFRWLAVTFISGYKEATGASANQAELPLPGLPEELKKNLNRPVPDLPLVEEDHAIDVKATPGNGHNGVSHTHTATLTLTLSDTVKHFQKDAPTCPNCGHIAVRNGACYKCLNCGESLGCS